MNYDGNARAANGCDESEERRGENTNELMDMKNKVGHMET